MLIQIPGLNMKYTIAQLPGEQYYREFINELEIKTQTSYRLYQDWRMKLGIEMSDIDAIISDQPIESFGAMKNIEYAQVQNECLNYAILEMKHWRTPNYVIEKILAGSNPSKSLATLAQLPFYIVKYYPAQENDNRWEFSVYNGNKYANKFLESPKHMSERQFVQFLYSLRNKEAPVSLIKQCCSEHRASNLMITNSDTRDI